MSFSDDDLKRLKEVMSFRLSKGRGTESLLDSITAKRLLARLEAAEEALIELYSLAGPLTDKGVAWRKAAGK